MFVLAGDPDRAWRSVNSVGVGEGGAGGLVEVFVLDNDRSRLAGLCRRACKEAEVLVRGTSSLVVGPDATGGDWLEAEALVRSSKA